MKIIDTTFERLPRERLEIGFKGENLRATVRIDCASVFAEYPNATPTLIVKPLFADAYPVVVDRNGTCVDWLITSEILSFNGDGEIQLVFYKDQVICKSAVSKIRVSRSLQVTGEMPDPVVQWIEDANRKLAEVDAQIVELEGMVDTATDAATRAEQSASTASTKAEQAAGSAATATEKATEATNAAGTATAKAAEAALSATQARNSAMSAANSESGATAKAAEAAQSAQTAAQKAEQITEAAQIATGKAGEASASATAAQASASNAASSATAAQASQTAARASETAASMSATQAGTSEQNAGTAAQTAMQKAAEASQSATNAATSATNAATSAETASTKAGEAAQSAQAVEETAEQLADSLEQINQNTQDIAEHEQYAEATYATKTDLYKKADIIHNTASGAIASFPDGAEMPVDEVTAQINPVQDLHGYDSPWPAGGGVNKLNPAEMRTSGTVYGLTISIDGEDFVVSGTFNSSVTNPQFRFALYTDQREIPYYCKGFAVDAITANHYNGFVGKADSNTTLTIQFNNCVQGETYNFRVRIVAYEGSTAPTEWTPYANICPISGFDGLTVTRTGKNLYDKSTYPFKQYSQYNPAVCWTDPIFVKAGTYTFKNASGFGNCYLNIYHTLDDAVSKTNIVSQPSFPDNTPYTYTFASDSYIRCQQNNTGGTSESYALVTNSWQMELGTTATDYEPYQGETYEVEFPTEAGTVYGGSLTIAEDGSGVLTVDSELEVFDRVLENEIASGLNYLNLASGSVDTVGNYTRISFAGPSDRAKYNLISSTYARKMCNMLSHVFSYADKSAHWYRNTVLYAFFPTSAVGSTKESVITYLKNLVTAGTPLTFWIPLATPITYTLTASQITTLLGENNLWHDANGDISVGYKADTKLYIDNKIAELVARIVNS